ncbi:MULTISPECIES: hypothetical protein [Providencia]|uniref:hypothetical protein n=1 Tax=Providencia TaxID=586 RepID=UPI001ADC2E52|nr:MULTISPECIES: hypothetical protein [Providencia]MBO8254874.1 hypothetical protein [Providencia rettgeri]MBO8259060.1 hypothetical protein [Providencia rettgeri]MDE4731191.1 hypothetical protein [Providencia rettgeri]
MGFKHSPAPWDLNKRTDGFNIVDGDNSGFVAHVPKQDNAHLIAAAPELLEALQEIVENHCLSDKAQSMATKAIAKALGQQ